MERIPKRLRLNFAGGPNPSIKHCREDQDYRGGMMAGVAKTDNAPQAHIASGVRPLADATVKLTTSRIRDSLQKFEASGLAACKILASSNQHTYPAQRYGD